MFVLWCSTAANTGTVFVSLSLVIYYFETLNYNYFYSCYLVLMDLVTTRFYLFVGFTFVKPQAFPGGKSLFTDITWNAYSFQMIGLNVSSYMMGKSFLATHFANPCYCLLGLSRRRTSRDNVYTFLHHLTWPSHRVLGGRFLIDLGLVNWSRVLRRQSFPTFQFKT